MPASECGLPFSTGGLVGENGQWTVQSYTNEQNICAGAGKNEQWSEREGQPLGLPEIKAPLTQVGVSAEISNGNPIGGYRRKIVSGPLGGR